MEGRFRRRPATYEAITFDELVAHSLEAYRHEDNGFDYQGHTIYECDDNRFMIPTPGGYLNMTPDDVLMSGPGGEIYPIPLEDFELKYERLPKGGME